MDDRCAGCRCIGLLSSDSTRPATLGCVVAAASVVDPDDTETKGFETGCGDCVNTAGLAVGTVDKSDGTPVASDVEVADDFSCSKPSGCVWLRL